MNWGALKNAALGLMFSNISGARKVELSSANVQEYVLNMPDAANFAFADLVEVCPSVMEVQFSLPLENKTISLEEVFPLYHKLLDGECVRVEEDGITPFTGYYLHGKNKLTFTDNREGTVMLTAAVRPVHIKDETLDSHEIDYPEKALTAAAYYMAHRLYLEDDVSIAMQYMNYYQSLKEELRAEFSRSEFGAHCYTNKAGWL